RCGPRNRSPTRPSTGRSVATAASFSAVAILASPLPSRAARLAVRIIYTILSNEDYEGSLAFAGSGPRQRAKQGPPRSERPAMTTEDQMKGPVQNGTLSAAIADQRRQSILDGTYPAGSQLRQDALGDAYGVSRIPGREALFLLEAEGAGGIG